MRRDFYNLQLYENGAPKVRHPRMFGDRGGVPLEPFTKAHPQYGVGNIQQMYADSRIIEFGKIDILPEGE